MAAALHGNLANGRDGQTNRQTDGRKEEDGTGAMTMIRSNTDQPHLLRWKWIIAPFWTESGGRTAAGGRGMLSSPCIPLCENRKIFFSWLMRDVHYDEKWPAWRGVVSG